MQRLHDVYLNVRAKQVTTFDFGLCIYLFRSDVEGKLYSRCIQYFIYEFL